MSAASPLVRAAGVMRIINAGSSMDRQQLAIHVASAFLLEYQRHLLHKLLVRKEMIAYYGLMQPSKAVMAKSEEDLSPILCAKLFMDQDHHQGI